MTVRAERIKEEWEFNREAMFDLNKRTQECLKHLNKALYNLSNE